MARKYLFPQKLYDLLEYAATSSEYSSSIAWSRGGTAFRIKDQELFLELLPKFFPKQTKYRSFVSGGCGAACI